MSVVVVPGEKVGTAADFVAGKGTYVSSQGDIISLLLGTVITEKKTDSSQKTAVHVLSSLNPKTLSDLKEPTIEVGDVVLCRVVRVSSAAVSVEIIAVKDCKLQSKYLGSIRKEDVRLHEEETFDMNHFFRLGDIVRAMVLSLGDARTYFLSTAQAEFGVRFAKSSKGNLMTPISWKEMEDPVTNLREKRKVAKP